MTSDTPTGDAVDDPAAELRLVEAELADLRREADDLRRELGDPAELPIEPEDRANLISSLEIHESLIDSLEARATELRQRLGQ